MRDSRPSGLRRFARHWAVEQRSDRGLEHLGDHDRRSDGDRALSAFDRLIVTHRHAEALRDKGLGPPAFGPEFGEPPAQVSEHAIKRFSHATNDRDCSTTNNT
jgi:hypothetical protein